MDFDGLLDDIDFSIEYDDLECRDFRIINESLENLLEDINDKGVSKNDMIAFNTLTNQEFDPNYPPESYTVLPSSINLSIACENIISSIFKGISKIFQFIYKMIGAFFSKIAAFFNWLAGGSKNESSDRQNDSKQESKSNDNESDNEPRREKKKSMLSSIKSKFKNESKNEPSLPPSPVTKKEKAIIKAVENDQPQGKEGNVVFENVINDKVVRAENTQKLLETATNDSEQNKYINVKSILEPFYGHTLGDKEWDMILNRKKAQLNTLVNALHAWWNKSHPIVSSASDLATKFSHELIEAIDSVLDSLNDSMQWWASECSKVSTMEVNEYLKKADTISTVVKQRKEDLQKLLVEKANRALSPVSFVRTKITEDINGTLTKALEEFKSIKNPQKSKVDFLQGLKEISWLKELSGVSNKIKEGESKLKKHKNDMQNTIDSLQRGYKESDKAIVTELGHFLKAMQSESQRFIGYCYKMAAFLKYIDEAVERNRAKSAEVHALLVAMGNSVAHDLKKAS